LTKNRGPVEGVIVALTGPDGDEYFTELTDSKGFAEVLVPIGKTYDMSYLSLGTRTISAQVSVPSRPNYYLKLTMNYSGPGFGAVAVNGILTDRFVLKGVYFESGKARLKPESFDRLDEVVKYLTHKKSAQLEISGHTNNVGSPKTNKALSQRRADACRKYILSKGIDAERISTVGHGEERPIATNKTEEGRRLNRRIEAGHLFA